MRAPLAVIDGYAEAMLDGVVPRDDEHVVLVRRESSRAQQLLDGLVDLVRLEAGLEEDAPSEPAAADRVAADIHERLLPFTAAAGVELRLDAVPARVGIPPRRLEQLWVNLVRNALRAVVDGGGSEIVVFVRRPGDGLVDVGVEDDGPASRRASSPSCSSASTGGAQPGRPGKGAGSALRSLGGSSRRRAAPSSPTPAAGACA